MHHGSTEHHYHHILPYMALCVCTSELLNSQIYPKLSNTVEISLLKGERVLVQGATAGWLFRDATKNYPNFAYSPHSSYLSFILFILCSSFLKCFDVAVVHHLPNCSSWAMPYWHPVCKTIIFHIQGAQLQFYFQHSHHPSSSFQADTVI